MRTGITPAWSFGGGTALALDLGHRVSYDIDAFLDSASAIGRLVPTVNETTRTICWNEMTGRPDYQWLDHGLKLIVRDFGEISFLATAPLVDDPAFGFDFEGREVLKERPAEIVAKKILYRGARFKARDIFDLAAVLEQAPEELVHAGTCPHLTSEVLDRVRVRIEMLHDRLPLVMAEEVNPTEEGRRLMSNAADLALRGLDVISGSSLTAASAPDAAVPARGD